MLSAPPPSRAMQRSIAVRVRLACVVTFLIGSLLPPYVPKAALAPQETELLKQQFLLVEDGFLMKSSSLTDRGARRAYTEGHVHVVREGDTLEGLARRFGIAMDTIRWANDIGENAVLRTGSELIILPVDGMLHTVKRGQTLLSISELYDIPVADIMRRNDLGSEFLLAGQQLIVPGAQPIVRRPVAARPSPQPVDQPAAVEPPTRPPPTPPAPSVLEVAAGSDVTSGVLQKPCNSSCFVTQYYHPGHYALDMQNRGGGAIYAAEAGRVIRADYGWNGGYGNVVEIDHGNDLVSVYGHNRTLFVSEGDLVARGRKIADMGNSGLVYGKTGIHVHFEVRVKGVKKNPLLYIQ